MLKEYFVGSLLLIFLLIVPLIEIVLFINIANIIGVTYTIILAIFTSYIGLSIIKRQNIKKILIIRQQIISYKHFQFRMIQNVYLLVIGLLLLLPGFFTDLFGLFLIIPQVQKFVISKIMMHLLKWVNINYCSYTIDGEFEKKNEKNIDC
ncbi:MAG: exclusion suppressor FxsA [Pantoea sp. Brub]|nr:exclusion suppressor FxsA [Pantoea sp. Brub]